MTIEEHILNRYSNEPTDLIAKDLNVDVKYVYRVAYKNGLKKSKEYKDKYQPGYKNLISYGYMTRFKEGHTSHNKGVPMSLNTYEKVKHTMFKKGNKPPNTQPVGTISLRVDKSGKQYQYIKISDRHWECYHRYIYEQHYGPIPHDHIVIFKDKNEKNLSPENLSCITKKDNMNINSIQNYPAPIKSILRLYQKLKRKINGTQ